jgi:fructose-1,6-bisphosphatase/sedoheptulose 1,7-bisphosphatase-like protein
MRHDVESYKADILKIFAGRAEITGSQLLKGIAEVRQISSEQAIKIYTYCRSKKLVKARHVVSHTYNFSINF